MAAGTTGPDELRFLWWNAQDFAHYRRDRSDRSDWPPSRRAYDEKRRRVGAVLAAGKQHLGGLELIGLCEVTRRAAERLRDEFLAGYDVVDGGGDESSFRVAWLVAPGLPIQERPPIITPDMPRDARPMPVVDLQLRGGSVRFVACHWPAFDESRRNRERMADHLVHELYDFLVTNCPSSDFRHAVVVGDLNDEPFSTPSTHLNAHRARRLARSAPVWQDDDARRVHLYNCSWRLLGERWPHGIVRPPDQIDAAGTLFLSKSRAWATVDQVIVSEGLVGETAPRIDEASVQVLTHRSCAPSADAPSKFASSGGTFQGVSDHLPVLGRVLLQE